MGIHVIKMPDIGEGIAEVEIVEWRVKPGDNVVEDQILADVMTDKATVEIPSPVHGTVMALGGTVGQTLPVGAELIRLEIEGVGNAPAQAVQAAASAPQPPRETATADVVEQAAAAAPAAMVPQPTRNAPPARSQPPSRPMREPAFGAPVLRAAGEKPLAAPAVRQRAWDMGIDLKYVGGSGPAGRIMHADLDAYVSGRQHGVHGGADTRYAELSGEEAVPVIGLRRRIAEKMQLAKRQIPHFTYVEEVDVTELETLRAQLNQRYGDERARLTILPLLMRAVVLSVRKFPQVNARFDDEAGVVTRFNPVHLGIATQTDSGLMVPVVRNAEARDPWESAQEVARLADAARNGRALREELSGSTITITSLGPLGGIVTTPVINHPEVAIVGVNRIVDRPMVRNGGLVARKMMNLSSSFDHRVIDGMDAAEFVQTIRGYLECPATLFVE
jgi:2-oxoisovalerate dehydrogenase E2 component (dihydrolipoyl transacylase)